MELKGKLIDDIREYCKLNGLSPSKFSMDMLSKAFMLEKYGDRPNINSSKGKPDEIIVEYSFNCKFEKNKKSAEEDDKPKQTNVRKVRKLN
jgi:hypothetical protein